MTPLSVKAVCFDLDDTLCGYWYACKIGLRIAFSKLGPKGFSSDECIRAWARAFRRFAPSLREAGWFETYLKIGEPTRTEQMRLTLLELGVDNTALATQLSASYLEERNRALRLFDDALITLQTLSGRFPLGLITNGPADIQRMEIETLGIERFFRSILIEGELGRGKPHESVFRLAESQLGAAPGEMVMIGNSYAYDVLPAMEMGWHGIWISRPSDVPPSESDSASTPEQIPMGARTPDYVLHELAPLTQLLQHQGLSNSSN